MMMINHYYHYYHHDVDDAVQNSILAAYILKLKKSADFTFQSKKICGKSAEIAMTTFCDKGV